MELEDFETIDLAREVARHKGWEHVLEAIKAALRAEAERLREEEVVESAA